jgi:hypothetical protein
LEYRQQSKSINDERKFLDINPYSIGFVH